MNEQMLRSSMAAIALKFFIVLFFFIINTLNLSFFSLAIPFVRVAFDDAKIIRFFASLQTFRQLLAEVHRTHLDISDKNEGEAPISVRKRGIFSNK